ncbi:MAG: DUF2497 domain-containing protein [Holosporales bacterium]|jgi:cell pole-organizing protein PopZ|nr:DUF2497 domain-containing protein [Holosporales bacterium]
MNFSGNKGGGGRSGDEMSMEDILMSIRKYVSEEEPKKKDEYPAEEDAVNADYGETDSAQDDHVIILGKGDVLNAAPTHPEPMYSQKAHVNSMYYTEQSDLSEEVITSPKKSGPFDKLTDALKSYGKDKQKVDDKKFSELELVYNFFRSVAEEKITKWIEDNMPAIVEEAIQREINKIKSGE